MVSKRVLLAIKLNQKRYQREKPRSFNDFWAFLRPFVKAKLFCPEIAGLFCRIAGLFCHDSRANLSLKPVCFGIAIS